MSILSGCDYLPSIPGVGLKTANSLLRKWKTAEQAIRAIAMEGKKSVPADYWRQFQLAEMCFLYQRVYCPLTKKLVHLKDPGAALNEETNAYVGRYVGGAFFLDFQWSDGCF
jgi:exonuclease-1